MRPGSFVDRADNIIKKGNVSKFVIDKNDIFMSIKYGAPEGSKSTEVDDHSVNAYFDIHVHV